MKRKWLAIGIILLFVGVTIAPTIAQNTEESQSTSRGNWLYVGGNGPGNYTKIQDAVDNASAGDTVFVFAGQYHERVNVTKTIHFLGENKSSTIIYYEFVGEPHWPTPIINIRSDRVTVSNFTVNITSGLGFCINLTHASNCSISNNILQGLYGFFIGNSSKNNEVRYNIIRSSSYSGSGLGSFYINMHHTNTTGNFIHHNHFEKKGINLCGKYTRNNTICDNYFEQCTNYAILAEDTASNMYARNIIIGNRTIANICGIGFVTYQYGLTGGNTVCDNIIKNCSGGGIATTVYGGDTITNNLIEHCGYGMSINENFVTIKNNTIRYCNVGQDLWFASPPSILEGNLYDHCTEGIEVWECMNTTFTRNTFSNNKLGVSCHLTYMTYHNYFIYNNFKGNRRDVYQELSRNRWSHNYWDEPRSLPKPIFGLLPFLQFDWQPAQEPYDIPGMS